MHPIFAELELAGVAGDVKSFLWTLAIKLKQIAQQGIDTPEERQKIEEAVLDFYDQYVNPVVPSSMQVSIREAVKKGIDSALIAAAVA